MPGGGHIDGLTPGELSGRPGTFTLLAGVVLSDQSRDFSGNLVVWPGTHHQVAKHLRDAGPDAIFCEGGIPPVDYSNPLQVRAVPGDLLLSTYPATQHRREYVQSAAQKSLFPDHRGGP
ncbi:MAG TPA: hypothetical protein DGG94_23280 [Micromonosporaceae bacterium]|nr:hypothetical protein [Micromonosporaceae bacterium]HCU52675.1 hypothetical protein [Micromonosporaceae bacterium]